MKGHAKATLSVAAIAGATVALGAALAAYHVYAPRRTPEGQPPLKVLRQETLRDLHAVVDDDARSARLLVMLSPT